MRSFHARKSKNRLGQSIETLYAEFETEPVASASIAQYIKPACIRANKWRSKFAPQPFARYRTGFVADALRRSLVERLFADGKRLKPREVVAEFDKYLHDELT